MSETIDRLSLKQSRELLQRVLNRWGFVTPLIAGIVLIVYPWAGANAFWLREIPLIAIYALIVSGLNLSWGFAGDVQFGQVAMFAAGAYVTGVLSYRGDNHLLLLLVLSAATAAVLGAAIALPAVRIGGWSLAMTSFFLVLLVPDIVDLFARWTNGDIGLAGVPLPTLAGHTLGAQGFYEVVVGAAIIWTILFRNIAKSRYGTIFRCMKESPVLAASLGISVWRTKVLSYVAGAVPAGMAGCFLAYLNQSISPDVFALPTTIGIVAASVLGGTDSVYGAVVGAAVLQLGPLETASFQQYSSLAYGIFLIVIAVILRSGLKGLSQSLLRRVLGTPTAAVGTSREPADGTAVLASAAGLRLSIEGVSKNFGGVRALDDVSLVCEPGRVTGLIGANGSGKTTLLNTISGFLSPTSGAVLLDTDRITGRPANQISGKLRVSRTFQTPRIPDGLTVEQVVASGRYQSDRCGVAASALRLPRFWRTKRSDEAAALGVLEFFGLAEKRHELASKMPLGARRLIEIARCMAARPSVLLLDEPASGLTPAEVEHLADVLRMIAAAGSTVVLVEHNFGLILDVADEIHVLELGRLIASGPPEVIEHDPDVVRSYLGEMAQVAAALEGEGTAARGHPPDLDAPSGDPGGIR